MYETQLSIVIVNYNVKYFLQQCLYSVRAATQGLETDIYVVDNHSTDQSVEYLRPLFPEVTFIENTENVGFAKANNQALRICKGEYVLILNPDTVIGEESLRSLYFFMEDHPEAGALGLKMINGNGIFLAESKRSFPTPWVSFCKLFGLSKLFPNSPKYASYALPYLSPDEQHEVDVLCGAFMLMRHEALDKIGLLDEDFFMYGEDIDLSYRFIQGGYKNFYMALQRRKHAEVILSFPSTVLRSHVDLLSETLRSVISAIEWSSQSCGYDQSRSGFAQQYKR